MNYSQITTTFINDQMAECGVSQVQTPGYNKCMLTFIFGYFRYRNTNSYSKSNLKSEL